MCSIICGLLMLALLICQFTPFWHYGEASQQATSIQRYVWFPTDCTELGDYLLTVNPEHTINSVVGIALLILFLCAAGCVVCFFKPSSVGVPILPLATGLIGIGGYLSKAVLRAGSIWWLHLALCVAMLVVAVISIVSGRQAK